MASHFECIGIDPVDGGSFASLLDRLMREGVSELRPDGGELVTWTDASGATVAFNVDPTGRIECVTPSFRGGARLAARVERFAGHPRCPFCAPLIAEVLDEAGAVLYSMALQLEDVGIARARLERGRPVSMAVSAFAEVLETWRDTEAFRKRRPGEPLEAFAPSGLVSPDGQPREVPEARAILTGVVLAAERRVNGATGRGFSTARLRTRGCEVELVVASWDAPKGLSPGTVVRASCWLVGRATAG